MVKAILDCYTDEASGLGVPPYFGVYPRYIAGMLEEEPYYLTIDDIRLWKKYESKIPKESRKTKIRIYNLSKNYENVSKILEKVDELIIVLGVHAPGKYLSAVPGTLREVSKLLEGVKCKKVLTGPVFYGTSLEGGKIGERVPKGFELRLFNYKYEEINENKGAGLLKQVNGIKIIEIETGRGCPMKCSFCLEPIKNKAEYRDVNEIINEVKAFYDLGAMYFRLGKQSCIYSYPELEKLLKGIWEVAPKIKVLHIDNANPNFVTEEKTELLVKYCTSGNVAALGVESFDLDVVKANTLNASPEKVMEAVRIINKYGRERGEDGMPRLLPGINIIFGLKDESRKTHEKNMEYLNKILKEDLWLRRINIRQVAVFEGTKMWDVKRKFLKKNRRYYYKWKREIREKIDNEMLKRVIPKGNVLKNVYMEVRDGNNTFGRQIGTYPIIVGVNGKLEIGKFYNIKITGHMLRSVTGEVI